MARGEHTRAAKIQKAEEREEKLVVLQLARDYARGHKIGARATVTTQLFPGVTYSMLHNALNNKIKALLGERYATDILTVDEGSKLEEWIAACARGKSPATGRRGGQGAACSVRPLQAALHLRCGAMPAREDAAVHDVRRHQEAPLPQGPVCGSARAAAADDAHGAAPAHNGRGGCMISSASLRDCLRAGEGAAHELRRLRRPCVGW